MLPEKKKKKKIYIITLYSDILLKTVSKKEVIKKKKKKITDNKKWPHKSSWNLQLWSLLIKWKRECSGCIVLTRGEAGRRTGDLLRGDLGLGDLGLGDRGLGDLGLGDLGRGDRRVGERTIFTQPYPHSYPERIVVRVREDIEVHPEKSEGRLAGLVKINRIFFFFYAVSKCH